MLDLKRLKAIRLYREPPMQVFVARFFLGPNYNHPLHPTRIRFEGEENLPRHGGSFIVMNHSDKYNYWPFQYEMRRRGFGYTASWVKGKYFENPIQAKFLDYVNSIPLPSKGYVMTKDFLLRHGRLPTDDEYASIKSLVEGHPSEKAQALVPQDYRTDFEGRFREQMKRVVELNLEALELGLNILIFPQGTRTVKLTRGHVGAAQMILHTRRPVIPVGSNGSEKCYPGNSPWSKGGNVVYRIGKPLTADGDLKEFFPPGDFVPFTESAEPYQTHFRRLTDTLMDRINDLVDPEYQYSSDAKTLQGTARFI